MAKLHEGEAVIFPTDTVYGVGVDPFQVEAVRHLYTIKGRSFEKGIPILLADREDLVKLTASVPFLAKSLIDRFWPGPLTIIVPRHPDLPDELSPNNNIAVRIPDHPIARALIRAAGGAIATTSANQSGQKPATSGLEALAALGGRVSLIIDDGPSPGDRPSTIVDCSTMHPHILREGSLTVEDLGLERGRPEFESCQ